MDDKKAGAGVSAEKQKALAAALSQIEKQFGKGSIMRLGDGEIEQDIQVVSTGSLGLDIALGVGGLSDVLTAATANAVPATPLPPATDTVTDEASGAEELHVTIAPVAYSGMLGLPLANLSYEVDG